MTGCLFLVSQGGWLAALLLYGAAVFGFSGGNIFYDALLVEVAEESRLDWVSGLGLPAETVGAGEGDLEHPVL